MAWYNTDWQYRRATTIDNSSNSSSLTNYQVRIDLTSSNFDFSKANSDGSDIRFTDSDGTTLIDFWIEKWDSSGQTATLWAEVPSVPASSSKDIYMYYGNSGATSASNIVDTFVFGDDFNDNDISDWTDDGKTSDSWTADNGLAHKPGTQYEGMHQSLNALDAFAIRTKFQLNTTGSSAYLAITAGTAATVPA